MTPAQLQVVEAEARAKDARFRLDGSIAAVQDQLKPAVLVRRARDEVARARGNALDLAILNPGPVALAGAGIAILFLARPLWRLARRPRPNADAATSVAGSR